jgi:p-cumate 2,3-dioxygenase subunit alpha
MGDESIERAIDGLIIDDVTAGQFKVHRRVYADAEIFEVEKDRIFNKSWLYLGHESEVASPGDFVTRHVAGRNVILTRGTDGVLRGLLNQCTHRGTLVCRAQAGTTKLFTCPYHAWTFDTTGKLAAVPQADSYGPDWDKSSLNLRQVPRFENYRGFVFVAFDPSIEPFSEYLKEAKDYVDLVVDQPENGWEVLPGTHKYSIRANWKLLVENFVDNYHFAILHKRQLQFMRDIGVAVGPVGAKSDVSVGRSFGNGHGVSEHQQLASFGRLAGHWGALLPEWTKGPLEEIRAKLEARVGPERTFRMTRTNRNTRIFPTLMILDHISPVIRIMTPRSVDYTEVQEWILAPKGESAELRALRISNNCVQVGPGGFVSPDDEEVLSLAQQGLANPEVEWTDSSRGMAIRRYVSSDEHQMRGMQRHWHELMSCQRVLHPENV